MNDYEEKQKKRRLLCSGTTQFVISIVFTACSDLMRIVVLKMTHDKPQRHCCAIA